MIRMALTGGIACGKSLAASVLADHGYAVCEADQVAHALYAPGGAAYEEVLHLAGAGALDAEGNIDRRMLGERVFAHPDRLQALNRILHPRVARALDAWLAAQQAAGLQRTVCVVPLLFEAGMEQGWDAVVCIGSQPEQQAARLAARGLTQDAIRARLAAQWPIEQKMEKADYRIWNDGSRSELAAAMGWVVEQIEEQDTLWEKP